MIALWGASTSDIWESRGTHGLIHHFNGTEWHDVLLSPGNVVTTLVGSSANDVWAFGSGGLMAHYDGATWSCAPRLVKATLRAAWVNGPNDVWVVGDSEFSVARAQSSPATLLHWDGLTWTRHPLTWPGSTNCSFVGTQSVWGSGASDVWLIYTRVCTGSMGARRVVARWNGSAWSEMLNENCTLSGTCAKAGWANSPTNSLVLNDLLSSGTALRQWDGQVWNSGGPSGEFNAIWGSGANDIWLARESDSARWIGSTFETNLPGASHVIGTSAGNVWLYGPGGARQHWDGSAWSNVSSTLAAPARGPGIVQIWGVDGESLWAVDTSGHILRRNFREWTSTGSPSGLKSVWATGSSNAWAVGGSDAVYHFNGVTWTQSSTGVGVPLNAIWGTSPGDIWAVGNATADATVTPHFHSTTLHFDGVTWSRVAIEPPDQGTTAANDLLAIHGSASNNIWAVSLLGRMHWDGSTWTTTSGGGDHVWVAGSGSSDVRVTTAPNLAWGTGPGDVWTVTHYGGTTAPDGTLFIQQSNGADATLVTTGFDTEPGIAPKALWVGRHDVYISGANGLTLHLTR